MTYPSTASRDARRCRRPSFKARATTVLALFSTDGSNAAHIHYAVNTTKLAGKIGADMFFNGLVDPITGLPLGKK